LLPFAVKKIATLLSGQTPVIVAIGPVKEKGKQKTLAARVGSDEGEFYTLPLPLP
jgi:hypothetical protein